MKRLTGSEGEGSQEKGQKRSVDVGNNVCPFKIQLNSEKITDIFISNQRGNCTPAMILNWAEIQD